MRSFVTVFTLIACIFGYAGQAVSETAPRWMPQDGDVLRFEVLRQGKPFGWHTVEFRREGEELKVRNQIDLSVSLGPVPLFRYKHDSEESWINGELHALSGETRKNGDLLQVMAQRKDDRILVEGSGFEGEVGSDIIPSSHWNIGEVFSNVMLSSENGETLPVEVREVGVEEIQAGGETLAANRYQLSSALKVDLWYDQTGRWVKCAFTARGQNIEYVLQE